MSERLTDERLAVIRKMIRSKEHAPIGAALLSELDALRQERDEAREEAERLREALREIGSGQFTNHRAANFARTALGQDAHLLPRERWGDK
jgi:histidinol-phosphate/aromatic aminotransferase/cobyric acid decarboxylase-like protein